MGEPAANGSTGRRKVMKGLSFYDDVNDAAWESKKACEESACLYNPHAREGEEL